MPGLDVVNASVIEPVFRTLTCATSRTETMLAACGLPTDLLEIPTGLVPLHSAEKFLHRINCESGDENFNFATVGTSQRTDARQVANIPLPGHVTGLDAARGFVAMLDGVLTGTRFYWRIEGTTFWILRTTRTTPFSDHWSIVQYNLTVMLEGMRRMFGTDLQPVAVRTGTQAAPQKLPEPLSGIPLQARLDQTGLGFDARAILKRTSLSNGANRPGRVAVYRRLAGTDADAISDCILHFLRQPDHGNLLGQVSNAFGMSPRTYQRRLKDMGTSHSAVLDSARLTTAFDLLDRNDRPVTGISLDLGYAHPGDFTRFFRRRTGVTPTQYRALL